MNPLPTRPILGAGVTVLAAVAAAMSGAFPLAVGLISAVLAFVAFVAQSERLRDEQHLVYRPVYARRQGIRHRARADD